MPMARLLKEVRYAAPAGNAQGSFGNPEKVCTMNPFQLAHQGGSMILKRFSLSAILFAGLTPLPGGHRQCRQFCTSN